ncbi:MAG: hypothetical protein PHF03_05270 [Syntrophomonadaceae bacterium]|nr:hypothetical protein [Syntrophomonadaceae bacterium]MDD4561573.1 hypothetical protein [Syntrophomonadaceae bacterium]
MYCFGGNIAFCKKTLGQQQSGCFLGLGILAGVLKLGLFGMEKFEFHYLDLLGIALLAVGARILLID